MGTAFLASASVNVVELSTKAVVGAAVITIIVILAITYLRNNKRAISILYIVLMTALIAASAVLFTLALQHINSISDWSVFSS